MPEQSLDINNMIQVTWVDITSQTEPWIEVEEARQLRPARMVTAGWIVEQTPEYLTIASTVDLDSDSVGDVNCIPTRTLLEVKSISHQQSA